MLTVFEKSVPGRSAATVPSKTTPDVALDSAYLAETMPALPELSEIDVVRHYTELSRRAFGVDNGFYPLGSCTMKYNPKVNEAVAALPGFTRLHPLQNEKDCQGALELLYRLGEQLKAISGMDAVTLQPAAGAHGEYTGLKLIKAYHMDRGDVQRDTIIVPDSAHGTNPASATLAGFKIVNIPSYADGGVNLEALQAALNEHTAGLMLTNPSTLGLFERNIAKVTELVHQAGGLNYYDGANLNAVMGIVRPADMGFDIIHFNVHKTFSTPHGGGGPGAGPVGCVEKLAQFLPSPVVVKDGTRFAFNTPAKSMGKVKAFYGNFLVLVRTYCYLLTLGRDGVKDAAEKAVLNANYLKKRLAAIDFIPSRLCMHEFTCSLEKIKHETGVSALDIAKAMIDEGIHPPTMYFPLIVHEALMFEPTETETKDTLDQAVACVLSILERTKTDPESLHAAPHNAQISRPDETRAARQPILRWTPPQA